MIELLLIQPTPVSVADALDAMHAAHAAGTIADRMTYDTLRSDGTFDAVSAVLRIDNGDTRRLRYETSGFAFLAQPGTLTGAGLGPPEPRRVLVAEREGHTADELLTGIVPTGPLPQLWSPDGPVVSDPALGVIRFTEASAEHGTTTITGDTALGPIRIETDAATGRLITLRASLRDGSIELRAGPVEPGDPEAWAIATGNRRIVSRIDQLAPNLAMLEAGEVLPDLSLQHPDGTGVTLADWHEAPPEGAPRAPWVLILFADATSADPAIALRRASDTLADIRAESLRRRAGAEPAERFWLRFRPLIVLVLAEDEALDASGVRPDLAEVEVLYSTRPDLTIDRLPLAPILAVGIDRDRVIGVLSAAGTERDSGAGAPLDVDDVVEQLTAPSRNEPE